MKKIIIFVCILALMGFVISIIVAQNTIYPSGRDTVETYGDGTFQILKGYKPNKELSLRIKQLSLVDLEKNDNLEEEIITYKKENNKLFVIGSIGYTIVDLSTKEIRQYTISTKYPGWIDFRIEEYGTKYTNIKTYDDFSDEEKEIFGSMKK